MSSAIASALALGEEQRIGDGPLEGATVSIGIVDACCLAKAYVSQGIQRSARLGKGPGPVAQTAFPSSSDHFPWIISNPNDDVASFTPLESNDTNEDSADNQLGKILPIVDTIEWVEKLAATRGVTDIQLRVKDCLLYTSPSPRD